MQFIKQLGTQLGFVVLIGSAIFSASSASAQISVTIGTNTDVIFDPAYVRTLFPSNPTQVDLILLGGVHFAPNSMQFQINGTLGSETYNPFLNSYGNLQPVGGNLEQQTSTITLNSVQGTLIRGVYRATNSPPLTLGLTSASPNPPSLSNGQYTGDGILCPYLSCVVLHYGYTIKVDSSVNLNPSFLQSTYTLRDSGATVQNLTQNTPIASPQIDLNPPQLRVKNPAQYLVVYSEQINPQRPGVLVINWTQFPVLQGQTAKLSFTNSKSNPTIRVSNVQALRTNSKIPLNQLNYIGLPLTTPGFQRIPRANGTLEPGQNTPPVNVESRPVDVPLKDIGIQIGS